MGSRQRVQGYACPIPSRCRKSSSRLGAPPLQMREHSVKAHGVEYVFLRDASLSRNGDAPFHKIEFGDGMCVGIDAELTAVFKRLAVPAPVKFEPPGIAVDLDGNAVFGAGF
jgi:hypothetical protein